MGETVRSLIFKWRKLFFFFFFFYEDNLKFLSRERNFSLIRSILFNFKLKFVEKNREKLFLLRNAILRIEHNFLDP